MKPKALIHNNCQTSVQWPLLGHSKSGNFSEDGVVWRILKEVNLLIVIVRWDSGRSLLPGGRCSDCMFVQLFKRTMINEQCLNLLKTKTITSSEFEKSRHVVQRCKDEDRNDEDSGLEDLLLAEKRTTHRDVTENEPFYFVV